MTGRAGAELKPTAGKGRPGKLSAVSGKHGRVRRNEPARRPRNTADRETGPTGPQRLPLRASGLARIASLPSEGPRFATGGSFPYDEEKIAFLGYDGTVLLL
ncbi:hypothetical protein [Paenibacillus sp. GbtcB18]|uniref:hypothetical protein n=1 Tax=Paenibacillus sp. GbtcB18 TaxID=2824763 RepID=UPI001C2FA1F0|nr:hypothetical protein [Paenibacillus sp. GbtcB18]